MANESLFHWAGEQLGQLIRTVVDSLAWVLTHLSEAVGGFYTGLRDTLGIGDSTASLVILIIGLLVLVAGLRRLLAVRLISGLIFTVLGVALLSWLMS